MTSCSHLDQVQVTQLPEAVDGRGGARGARCACLA